eukprot:TRINITY_DN19333_c0_g1_i1.p1 TRINITY_DN19333_c0_g1~~TRINITY_DN19333_c0_g1_i1.p1  ORF type:complete len:133 (+),score=34.39 TRINITY_DN19333_c0_g1_i1:95-493(+)
MCIRDSLCNGQLGAHWRFPSDHLPVGCVTEDGLRMVSFNLLNSRFLISNLEGCGLKGSLPWTQYTARGVRKVKLRDCMVLLTLDALMAQGPHRASILALQECSKLVLSAIAPRMKHWGFALATDQHLSLIHI